MKPMNKTKREKLIKLAKALYVLKIRMLMNPIKYFNPQPYQIAFWESLLKLKLIFGGNRSGKTMNGAAYVIKKCLKNPGTKAWACTWAKMSVPIQQKKIKELLPMSEVKYAVWTEQRGFTHRIIIFNNGSIIRFKTYEEGSAKFQGAAQHIIWNDEECPEDVYNEQMARLIDFDGEMIISMTPINGITWIYTNVVTNDEIAGSFAYWYWPTEENKKINQKGFKRIISQYGPKEAQVRSAGTFLNLNSGRLYYAFDRDINMKKLDVNPALPIRLSFDFNVNPMSTLIFQIVPGNKKKNEQDKVINIIQSLNTPDCNARMQCDILLRKLKNWEGEIIIYGDASNQRRTETADVNDTNWKIVKEHFPTATYKVPTSNPNIMERVAWVNAKIYNFDNRIGLYINNTRCIPICTDLEQGIWAKNGKEKNKKNPLLNHNSDTLDYIVAKEFPLKSFAIASSSSLEVSHKNQSKRVSSQLNYNN
jgi:phage terminase large subunit-like protein